MKIAIVSPYATVVPHFETELEIAQQHLDRGDEVAFLNCRGGLANCDFNVDHNNNRCRECVGRREMGLELLEPKIYEQSSTSRHSSQRTVSLQLPNVAEQDFPRFEKLEYNFPSITALKEYRIENFDIGYAVLSSLVSHCRDSDPDLTEHQDVLKRFLSSAFQTYRETQAYIDSNRPDRIYVFNGRFAAMRAVFRAAQSKGVECCLHERGCDGRHYNLLTNHLPHDIPAMQNVIHQYWSNGADNPKREALAAAWYQERVKRVERNWHSFVKEQQSDLLPTDWDDRKKNIVVFNSSDDEFVAIGDCWKNELYCDQTLALEKIAKSLLHHPQVHLTLRMHPNLRDTEHRHKQAMLSLQLPNLTVLPPNSPVDSYALMKASDCVVTFGSTIGIEAVYWGRPSVLLGPAFYRGLGGTYQPNSHAETIELLSSHLQPLDKTGALVYGFWLQTYGIPFQYVQTSGLFDGQFKSQTLYARPPKKTLITRIRSELHRVNERIRNGFNLVR